MAHRVVALSLVSAHNLKEVNVFSRMEVYAVASVSGDPSTRRRSKTDRRGGRHPAWDPDDTFRFVVPPTAAAAFASGASLHVLLRTERLFSFGDGDVGEVFIPVADLLAGACGSGGGATEWQSASFQVRRVRSTKRRGTLKVSYCFGPVMAPVLRGAAAVAPKDQVVYPPIPPSFPPMLPGAVNFRKKSSLTLGLGDIPSSDKPASDVARHGTAAAGAGPIAV